jgi:putative restriction endonuclease
MDGEAILKRFNELSIWRQGAQRAPHKPLLTLCVLHHKTFNPGAFTVSDDVLLVSDQANDTTGFHESLMAYRGRLLHEPLHPDWRSEHRHLDWHGDGN